MRDGVRKAEGREARSRKRRPVHGRSLVHVLNAIAKRARDARKKSEDPPTTP